MVVIQTANCGIIDKNEGLWPMHALKQQRPELEDHPTLLKFSQEASSLMHAVESMLKIVTQNCPLSFHSSFGLLFDLPLVQWEVFASVDATDVTRCLQANL